MKVIQKKEKQTKLLHFPIFKSQILPDDEMVESTNSLNLKEKEVFNVVHTWAEDYVKYDGHNVELINIFLSGSECTGKLNDIQLHMKNIALSLQRFFSLEPTGISAVNIGAINHSGLGSKPGIKLIGLNDKSKTALINRLSKVKTFN